MLIRWAIPLLVLVGMLAGCGAQPGKTMITWGRGDDPPPLTEAMEDGVYALYASNSGNALYRVELEEGDEYGFEKTDAGIIAVADDKRVPLQNTLATSYFWKFQGQPDD